MVGSEASATALDSSPTQGNPDHTTVPASCAMVGHGQGSDNDPECMQNLRFLYRLHLTDIVTIKRCVRGYNHQKLFARKYEEPQRVSLKRINDNRAHYTSNVCFKVILRGSCIVNWQGVQFLAVRVCSEVLRRGLHIVVWRAQSPIEKFSEVIRRGTVAYRRLTSAIDIQKVFRGHLLRVAYHGLRSAIAIQKFSDVIFVI